MTRGLAEALKERDKAITLAIPTINTPISTSTSELLTERPTTGTTPRLLLSYLLTLPALLNGYLTLTSSKDLVKTFVNLRTKSVDKMMTNRDRFLTPQTRLTYVASRLGALPHAHKIP
jgi:hypothetical protein